MKRQVLHLLHTLQATVTTHLSPGGPLAHLPRTTPPSATTATASTSNTDLVSKLQELLQEAAKTEAAVLQEGSAQETLSVLMAALSSTAPISGDQQVMINYLRGHTYECPNGHMYVIADCGAANQAGVCPECGAAVGGAAYNQLHGGNRSAEERLAHLAREAGGGGRRG